MVDTIATDGVTALVDPLDAIIAEARVKDAIRAHILMHEAGQEGVRVPALGLLLLGPPGVGKTVLALKVAKGIGHNPHVSSAASHAGSFEADSSERYMADRAQAIAKGKLVGRIGVHIINDLDKGLVGARDGGRGGTPNVGLLLGTIQGEADKLHAGESAERCAVIATANRDREFPPEFKREGRWRIVKVNPGWHVRRRQLLSLIDSGMSARVGAAAMLLRFPRRSIAFLAQAVAEAREASVVALFDACGGDMIRFRAEVRAVADVPLSGLELWRAAHRIAVGRSHLE